MIVVIGSGMGGLLTAAILGKLYGKSVTILESHSEAGGSMHCFKINGVEFDVGLHYAGGMRGRLGKFISKMSNVEWHEISGPHDVLILPNKERVEFGNKESQRKVLAGLFGSAFAKLYVSKVEETQRAMNLYYIGKLLLPNLLFRLWVYVFCFHASAMMKASASDELRFMGANDKCIAVCCYHWADFGSTPKDMSFASHAMLVAHWWEGNFYPIGGSKAIVQGLRNSIRSSNGKLKLGTRVVDKPTPSSLTTVRARDGRCKQEVVFDSLIYACGRRAASKIASFSMPPPAGESFFMTYLCFKGNPVYHKLPSYNTWVMGGESLDHDANMSAWKGTLSSCLAEEEGAAAQGPSPVSMMFISFNCAKDPLQLTVPTSTVSLVCPVDSKWDTLSAEEYEKKKRFVEDLLCKQFFKLYPRLKAYEKFRFSGSPTTFDTYIGTVDGCIYGAAKRGEMQLRAEDGVLMSGADVVSAGVSGAAIGGIIAAQKQLGARGLPLLLNI